MTTRISDDQIDMAMNRLLHGDPLANILASFPAEAADLRPLLHIAATLETIRPVETPSAESLASDRNDFLAQITELQLQPVSPTPIMRLKGWLSQQLSRSSSTSTPQQKEIRKMSALVLKGALILVIAFGSLGGTLAAAADSLPDSAVYPLKLAMEQARLTLRNDLADQAGLHLAFAHERTQEMVRLANKGEVPEEALLARMQAHMRTAYQLAAQAGDEQMHGLLVQAQTMIQASRSDLESTQDQVQARVRARLQEAGGLMLQWQHEAESGLQDPGYFRWRFGPGGLCDGEECEPPFGGGDQNKNQYGPGGPPCEGEDCELPFGDTYQEQHQNGAGGPLCEGEDCQPPFGEGGQEQHQYQYGSGDPCQGEDCQPPYGKGNQEQHQYQHGPGAPPCEGEGCEPPYGDGGQEQNQYQHGPDIPPCEGGDCEPPGNGDQLQNQHQNTEQNEGQGDTQNQNQEQNGQGSNGQQSGGSEDSSDSNGAGGPGYSGGSDDSGGSDNPVGSDDPGGPDDSGGSGNSGGSNDSGGSGGSSGSGGGNGRG